MNAWKNNHSFYCKHFVLIWTNDIEVDSVAQSVVRWTINFISLLGPGFKSQSALPYFATFDENQGYITP